jgi:hypothetical protein
MALLWWLAAVAAAQTSPISMALVADKVSYLPSDPIRIQVTVENTSVTPVIARQGFQAQDFHLKLIFIDPDGRPIRTRFAGGTDEPGPPLRIEGRAAVRCEIIAAGEAFPTVMEDARFYYDLTKFGHYTAQVVTSLETFTDFTEDPETGACFAFLDDPQRQAFEPLVSNLIAFELVNPTPLPSPDPGADGTIQVDIVKRVVGLGRKPGTTRSPLEGVPVRLIRRADVPTHLAPLNFKTYELIYHTVSPVASAFTNATGRATFASVEQGDYLVIALFMPSQDFRHMGSPVRANDRSWGTATPIQRQFSIKQQAKGNHEEKQEARPNNVTPQQKKKRK